MYTSSVLHKLLSRGRVSERGFFYTQLGPLFVRSSVLLSLYLSKYLGTVGRAGVVSGKLVLDCVVVVKIAKTHHHCFKSIGICHDFKKWKTIFIFKTLCAF